MCYSEFKKKKNCVPCLHAGACRRLHVRQRKKKGMLDACAGSTSACIMKEISKLKKKDILTWPACMQTCVCMHACTCKAKEGYMLHASMRVLFEHAGSCLHARLYGWATAAGRHGPAATRVRCKIIIIINFGYLFRVSLI